MKKLLFAILLFLPYAALGQITQIATTGLPAPQLSGTGSPSANYTCNAASANVSYIQTDATNGRLWLCDNSSGSLAWDHLLTPIQNIATTGTITAGSFILGGCTAVTTVTVTGAVVGTNAALAAPIYVSAPTGSQGLFNLTAWVSATNMVSVQGCALGVIGTVPNFTAKVFLY